MKTRTHIFILALSLVPVAANAQWAVNGTPVTTAPAAQGRFRSIADGAGGMIVVWADERSGNTDIYAQKLDAFGVPKWTIDGLAVCTAADFQDYPQLCSDGAGGCIITWEDHRSGSTIDVYAQRITSAGTAQWAANGVVIVNAIADQDFPVITTDGSGGAIITWQDARNGNWDIFAQRINGAGAVQWAANGKSVCVVAGFQSSPAIVSDGASGAIVAWEDLRNGNSDIYAQRMSSSGGPQWTAGGVALCTQAANQSFIQMATDGSGGAVLAWSDSRAVALDVYAQRVSSAGSALWQADGVGVCVDPNTQYMEGVTTDGAGGIIVAWEDYRLGEAQGDIYAGHVSATGIPQWQYNGVPVCNDPLPQYDVSIDSDGAGGAVLAWSDQRAGGQASIYSQRINNNGQNVWDFNGVAVSDLRNDDDLARIVWSGGAAIMPWRDVRLGAGDDIFAQRVDGRFGAAGHPEPTVTSVADVRNDQGGHVKVNWKASTLDILGTPGNIPVNRYTVWRATDAASAVANGSTVVVNNPAKIPDGYKGRAFYVQHAAATDYYWEYVGTQNALKIPSYSMSVETRADSVAGNAATHHFMVAAQTENDYTHWPSNEMAGRSVDNLAPGAPLTLTAQRVGNYVHLTWRRVRVADLHNYTVYRKTSSGVTPIPANFLSDATDTVLTDNSAPASALYYIVTATDFHANQGNASNEAAVGAATGVGNLPPITELMVMQNKPNPFGTSSSFDLGLPGASKVSIEVYDVGGRRVASHALGEKPAGWQSLKLDALDDAGKPLASGVYFYRISAAGKTLTRKMVIAR